MAQARLVPADPGMAEEASVAGPKKKVGRIIPSRYLQTDKNAAVKTNSATTHTSVKGHDKVPLSKSRQGSSQECRTSGECTLGRMQSTLLEGHGNARPELEFSSIEDRTSQRKLLSKSMVQSAPAKDKSLTLSDRDALIDMIDAPTLVLNCASIQIEENLALLQKKAEENLLTLAKEEAKLQRDVHRKKLQLLRLKKELAVSEALDRQVEVLSSVHEQRVTFQDEYKHFATALDTTRHELPVKELCVDENKGQFLAALQENLAATQNILKEILLEHSEANASTLGAVKDLAEVSRLLDVELPRTIGALLNLSATVSKETALSYQKACEDRQGLETMKQWYFR